MVNILFHRVPREVRDKIYRLLLVKDREEAIEFTEWNNEYGYGRVSGLHPKILRTCKHAYAEGLSALYEQNLFHYKSFVGKGIGIDNADPLKGNLSRVKHFKLIHFIDTPGKDDTPETYISSVSNSPSTTMRSLTTVGCSLKTLELEFRLLETPANALQHQESHTIWSLAYDQDLSRAIATIAVSHRIVLTTKGYRGENTNSFDYMANFVGSIKNWAITEDFSEARQGTWDISVRTWVLKPAAAATREKVSLLGR